MRETCGNCRWNRLGPDDEPCRSCVGTDEPVAPSHWQPAWCLIVADERKNAGRGAYNE